jgi:hypothetical protein
MAKPNSEGEEEKGEALAKLKEYKERLYRMGYNVILYRYARGLESSLWEADHIVPVSEGGGQCGLDNYRTLCVPCHKAETARLKREQAIKRSMPLFYPCK